MSLTQTAIVYSVQGTVSKAEKTQEGLIVTIQAGRKTGRLLFEGPRGRQLDIFAEQSIKASITTEIETEEDTGALIVIAMEAAIDDCEIRWGQYCRDASRCRRLTSFEL